MSIEAAMPGLQAEDDIQRNGHHAYDPRTVYELVLLCTGDEKMASAAGCRRAEAIMLEQSQRSQGTS